jgi:tetratricopeptide (TPR) repeat protein
MKKSFMVTAICITILLVLGILATSLSAQEGRGVGRLVGFVLGSDKKPIADAKVFLEYRRYDHKLETVTDAEGKFTFTGLGPGDVRIFAEKEGYVRSGLGFPVSSALKNPPQYIIIKKVEEAQAELGTDSNDLLRGKLSQAQTLFTDRKFEAALPLFQETLKERPELYKIGIQIANCYLELTRYNEAIEELKTVLAKILGETPDPKGNVEIAKIYASLGDTYMRQNNFKEAEEYFKKSIDISPLDHALAYNIAEIMFAAGKTDEAIKYYDLAITINPKFAKSYMQRGYAYLNAGDTKNAIASFKQFLEVDPQSPDADAVREVINSLK